MEKKITIKYVSKASQWCKTTITFEGGKKVQKQEWSNEKPKLDK